MGPLFLLGLGLPAFGGPHYRHALMWAMRRRGILLILLVVGGGSPPPPSSFPLWKGEGEGKTISTSPLLVLFASSFL